jgi:hypothetical protein
MSSQQMQPAIVDPRPPPTTSHVLGGKIVAAGPTACETIGALLHVAASPFRLHAAAWMDHAVEVAILDPSDHTHVFRIERRTPDSKGLVLTRDLNIYSRGKDLPAALARLVAAGSRSRLAGWTVDHLAVVIASDPQSGKPGLPMPPSRDEASRPRSLLDTWGAEDSYADFFAGGEIARSQLDSIDPSKLFHFVQHCDAECLYVNPHSVGAIVTLVNYPWDDRVRAPGQPAAQNMGTLTDLDFIEDGMVTTDLVEDDVILGNPGKLTKLLEYAVSRPHADDKLLFVSNTCVPTVIGEDVESAVKRVRSATGKPVLYLTVTPRSMTNVFQSMLMDRRLEAEAKAGPPRADAVNLIGFAGPRTAQELGAALATAGVAVNTMLLPDLTTERIDAMPGAALSVLYPNQLWQHLYDQLMVRSRIRFIDPPAPFGVEATRSWIETVVRALGVGTDLDAAWDAYSSPLLARWQELRAEASAFRLGFVIRDQEAYFLTTPASSWGVPLLAFVEEMGFGVDVLVRVSTPSVAKDAAIAVRKVFRDPKRHTVRAFDSFAMLRQRLQDSPARAFLSYHFYDWRLTEAGKGAFSIQHFEMGLPGAIRTIERLLQVCRNPFYAKYSRFLRRTAEGLRPMQQPPATRRAP